MAIKDLYRMAVFAKIVEKGSISAAAETLGLGKSAVSQHLSALEDSLAVKLLTRSTRALTLTEEGRAFYESCALIAQEAERAETRLDATRDGERGKVKITCSYNLGLNFVVPAIAEFRRIHPNIDIDLLLEDRIVNMVDEGIDVALRSGWLTDSALYAVALAPMQMIVCASPIWLADHAVPTGPQDLAKATWVGITGVFHPDRVALESDGGDRTTVALHCPIRVNSGIAARYLIESGVGIGMLPDYATGPSLASGGLVHILPAWRSKRGAISALFPSRHHQSRRSRLLIDFLKTWLLPSLTGSRSRISA